MFKKIVKNGSIMRENAHPSAACCNWHLRGFFFSFLCTVAGHFVSSLEVVALFTDECWHVNFFVNVSFLPSLQSFWLFEIYSVFVCTENSWSQAIKASSVSTFKLIVPPQGYATPSSITSLWVVQKKKLQGWNILHWDLGSKDLNSCSQIHHSSLRLTSLVNFLELGIWNMMVSNLDAVLLLP